MVFAAHSIVIEYIKLKKLPFNTIDRHGLKHDEVIELMGKALVYIGNSSFQTECRTPYLRLL